MTFKFKLFFVFSGLAFSLACVPATQFEDLQDEQAKCEEENQLLKEENKDYSIQTTELKAQVKRISARLDSLKKDSSVYTNKLYTLNKDYDKIKRQYNDLQRIQNQVMEGNIKETRQLLKELQTTQESIQKQEDELRSLETSLEEERANLNLLTRELESKKARLIELETILYKKDSAVNALKDKVTKALLGFEDKGLNINLKNGKVYVSLEEKLLFQSGSTEVDPKGVAALKKLAGVLAKNPDINIMVEGHTDDVPYISSEAIKDNWDLSVKRATAIVRILLDNSNIDGSRIIAAGRSKYLPVEKGKSSEARRKNRRTEIILTPKLDELFQILESQ